MNNPPTGTVTFLFTDIEGSTKLARTYPETWEGLRGRHDSILRAAIESYGGFVFQVIGDSFYAAFHKAGDALKAALTAQRNLQSEPWGEAIVRVRMGIHTGEAETDGKDYRGYLTLSLIQRVMSAGYGGQILLSDATEKLILDQLPKDVSLRDMGEHKFKDMSHPVRVFQVSAPDLQSEFPALRTLNVFPNNLPAQLTSFIGREKEIVELKRELNDHHLVTLTGSGGTGKTRLSLQVAAEVMDSFPDGVWFLELAPVTDPALVPNTLANLLGLRESAETKQTISELVCGYLHTRKALLVFDNCEHLIEACSRFADLLLRSCKDVKILASSREALGVAGEMDWHVPSLSLPDIKHLPSIEQLSQYEAVRLFIERATLVQPHFSVTKDNAPAIAQICFRLDGIPLAIELAAARANVLAVDQIAKRLDDRFRLLTGGARTALPRQQTLRALIDWSYNLLSEDERLLFRRLAVFVGGWTLEAAEAVCSGEGIESDLVLDLLSQLVNKSLVVMTEENGESRYHPLETIRQYAREKLFELGEGEAMRDRHMQALLKHAEKAEPEIRGANQLFWLDRVEAEYENMRAALEWSREHNLDACLRLVGALWRFWDLRAYSIEAIEWFEQSLALTQDQHSIARARVLSRASVFFRNLNDPKKARQFAEEAATLSRNLNERSSLAMALSTLGELTLNQPETAQKLLDEGLTICEEIGDHWLACIAWLNKGGLANRQNNPDYQKLCIEKGIQEARLSKDNRRISRTLADMAFLLMDQGKYAESRKLFKEGLVLSRQINDPNASERLMDIAFVDMYLEDYPQAESLFVEALATFESDDHHFYQGITIMHLAFLAWIKNDTARFIELLQEALKIKQENQENGVIEWITFYLGRVALLNRDLALARDQFSKSLKGYQKLNDKPGCADCLAGFGMLALAEDQLARSAKLFGAYQKLVSSLPSAYPFLVRKIDEQIAMAKEQLGRESFENALKQGKEMTLEQALAFALEETQ